MNEPSYPAIQNIKQHQFELIKLSRRKDISAEARVAIGCVVEFLGEYMRSKNFNTSDPVPNKQSSFVGAG